MADQFEFVTTLLAWNSFSSSVFCISTGTFRFSSFFNLPSGGKATHTSGAKEGDYTKKMLESHLFFQEICNNFVYLILLVGALCVISSHQEDLDYHSFP